MHKAVICAGLLVVIGVVFAEGAAIDLSDWYSDRAVNYPFVDDLALGANRSNNSPVITSRCLKEKLANGTASDGWKPVSNTIWGNIMLIFLYGIILGYSAKLISDGAEMLLDLGLPAGIIGGVVLPLLGAVPDSAMIVASGAAGSAADAQEQIDVGMGTLAGSTIMLLTIPWLGSLILGRVDIINGQGRDKKSSPFTCSSLWTQGVTVLPDVTRSALVMLITMIPYFIVQGADWHYGPTKGTAYPDPKPYIKDTALVTAIFAFIFFVLYLIYQVYDNVSSQRRAQKRDEEKRKQELVQRVLKQFILSSSRSSNAFNLPPKKESGAAEGEDGETQPLVPASQDSGNLQKKYFGAWKMSKGTGASKQEKEEEEKEEEKKEEAEDPKWKMGIKCAVQLILGVGLVTLFSDPMVDALTDLTDKNCSSYIPVGTFYVSFVVTPLCSNASELVSSLMFASKKTKINSSMTYSQLYGAATMNNTLCLGIFAALVYFRSLEWEYSAEVSVIIFIEVLIGIVALISGLGFKHTYYLWLGFFIGALYFVAIGLVAILENVADWK